MIPDHAIVIPTCSRCGEELLAVIFQAWPEPSSTWVCMSGCGGMMLTDERPSDEELWISVTLAERALGHD